MRFRKLLLCRGKTFLALLRDRQELLMVFQMLQGSLQAMIFLSDLFQTVKLFLILFDEGAEFRERIDLVMGHPCKDFPQKLHVIHTGFFLRRMAPAGTSLLADRIVFRHII